jgi:endonuclease/exonuclease/phosphatase family metal-dependent hydrolase
MELNVLETIERDLIEKYSEKGDIILMGDFNARTGSEEDLIISDDTSHVPLSDNQYVIDTAVGKRSSHDSHIDTRGKELLDMCISNQLRILNGRTFGDTFGAYTCYKPAGCSVVDYVIVSQHLLCQILYMQISNLCRSFVALLISEVVKFISSFKKLSSLFLIFGFKNP